MKFNKQKGYNDPAEMFPGNNRNSRLENNNIFTEGMSKMFRGIQGIMASDIQSRHSMLSGTIREKRRESREGEEEHTSLVTSGSNRPADTDTTHIE